MKLALGTVQFGLPYGIANAAGQTPHAEVAAIVARARALGMTTLDTAIAYGDSEARLGAIGIDGWRVVSKLPAVDASSCADVGAWVEQSVAASLERLRVRSLDGLLLHRPQQLLEPFGPELYGALAALKSRGVVTKVGVSIYEPSELNAIVDGYDLDLVQAPLNLFDRRLVESGWLDRLTARGTEVHVRSIFLQGLLVMPPHDRPAVFDRWSRLFRSYDRWIEKTGVSRLGACVRFALSYGGVSQVVVGVDSRQHLEEVVAAARGASDLPPAALATTDPDLLNPARWPALSPQPHRA